MANRQCNLECVEDNDEEEVVEFVGPVKIILVDRSKQSYNSKVCNAAFIVLAQMSMATTCIIVALYSLTFKKKQYFRALHVFLCTLGLQLLIPTGVLTMNPLNGAAAPMTVPDRKFEHGMVQIFGLVITTAGSVVSYFGKYPKFITIHSVFGIIANSCGIINAIVGIVIHFFFNISEENVSKWKSILDYIHKFLGIMTITASSLCFLDGIIHDSFKKWLPLYEMLYLLFIFCIFYTGVVIYKPLLSLENKKF